MDFSEFLRGKEYTEKRKQFEEKLQLLENNNIDFFKNRSFKRPTQIHDRIENHYTMLTENSRIRIGFNNPETPENIKNEMFNIFNSVFGYNNFQ